MPEFISVKVLTLRELFSGDYRFELPWFQRAYAWNVEEVGRLLTHVLNSSRAKDSDEPYFLGTLVLAKTPEDRKTALVDGQQRIMTLTILFAVLRDMEALGTRKAEIHGMIASADAVHYAPQENCAELCRRLVQNEGGTDISEDAVISDAELHIVENRDHLRGQLSERLSDARSRWELFQYLADRCYVAIHVFRDSEEAWRRLQRDEETQHRFNASDKAKTSLTLAMPPADRESCGIAWDDCEALVGSRDLFELLGHIRLIKRRSVSTKPVEAELSREFELNTGGQAFVERHLMPAAKRVAAIRAGAIATGAENPIVAAAIERASWIDDQIWMPAALHWLEVRGEGDGISLFFRRLERLVWLMRLSGMDGPKKEERIIRLLSEIEGGARVDGMKALSIDATMKIGAVKALRSDAFDRKHFARPTLRLVSLASGQDPGLFAAIGDTTEHIYPQGKGGRAPWRPDFPPKAEASAHRLGNLTLLSKEENRRLANKVWSDKRPVYALSQFILSRELASLDRWTPEAIAERTERLIGVLIKYWDLER